PLSRGECPLDFGETARPLAEAERIVCESTGSTHARSQRMGEPLTEEQIQTVREGYPGSSAGGATMLALGALVNGEPRADVQITIPLGMLNRHGLIAGATGTG